MRVLLAYIFLIAALPMGYGQKAMSKRYVHLDSFYADKIIYDNVGQFHCGIAPAYNDGKIGFIDSNGNAVTDFKYNEILLRSRDKILVESGGKLGILDSGGKEVVPCIFDFIYNQPSGLYFAEVNLRKNFIVVKDRKFGGYYNSGKVAFACLYDTIHCFKGKYAVAQLYGKYGVIDTGGIVIVPFKYDNIKSNFSDDIIVVKGDSTQHMLYGFVDAINGNTIPCIYDYISPFSCGIAIAKKDGRSYFINKKGEHAMGAYYEDIHWDYIENFGNGYASVKMKGKWGLINRSGKLLIPCVYADYLDEVKEGKVVAKNYEGKYGMVDTNNKIVLPFNYEYIRSFSEGRAAIEIKGKWGYVNKQGIEVIPAKYQLVRSFERGVAEVCEFNGASSGWINSHKIDTNGNQILEGSQSALTVPYCNGRYCQVEVFSGKLAAVRSSIGRWGFIDIKGTEVIPCRYTWVTSFIGGYATVSDDSTQYIIDESGNRAFQNFKYNAEIILEGGKVIITQKNKCGIADTGGKLIVPFKYDNIGAISEGLISVKLGSWSGYINLSGIWKISFKDKVHCFSSGIEGYYPHYFSTFEDTIYDYGVHCTITLRRRECSTFGAFSEGVAPVLLKGKAGYINQSGRIVIPFKFNYANTFRNGWALVLKDSKHGVRNGLIDKNGKLMFSWKYNVCSNFSDDGIAMVNINGKYGFINRLGDIVIPCTYDYCSGMPNGKNALIPVAKNGTWGYIDKTGKRVLWFD